MAVRRKSNIPVDLLPDQVYEGKRAIYLKWKLSCVRCSVICNPYYYMICKEKGHFLCGQCAWLEEPRPSHYLCCSPENLRKGPPGELEDLLERSKWNCMFKENGCEETPRGMDWESHVANCIYK